MPGGILSGSHIDVVCSHETREVLDPIIECTETLQYRFRKYGAQNEPLVVPDADMERFISVVEASESPKYYSLQEITPEMCSRRIRIIWMKKNTNIHAIVLAG